MTLGRGLFAAAVAACLLGMAAVGSVFWLFRGQLLDTCDHQVGTFLGNSSERRCFLEIQSQGLVLGVTRLEAPQHRLTLDQGTVTLAWSAALDAAPNLFRSRMKLSELPWSWAFYGGVWQSDQTGRMEWEGGTTHPVTFERGRASHAPFEFSYRLVEHPQKTAGTVKGTLLWEPSSSLEGAVTLACRECQMETAGMVQSFKAEVSWYPRGLETREPKIALHAPDFAFSLPGRWLLRDPVPPFLSAFRASLTLEHVPGPTVLSPATGDKSLADTSPSRATTRLSAETLSGEVDLQFTRVLIMQKLEELLGIGCTGQSRQTTSDGASEVKQRRSQAALVCGFVQEFWPRSVRVSDGQAQFQADWLDADLMNLNLQWSAVAAGHAAKTPVTLQVKGQNQSLAEPGAKGPKGFVRAEEPGFGHLDLLWSVGLEPPRALSAEDLWAGRLNTLTRLRSELALSREEGERILQLLLNRLVSEAAQSLGLPIGKDVKVSWPDDAVLKEIEREGKAWLKNSLQEERSEDSPSEREERRRQRRESEKKLKDALGRILGR